MAARSADEPDEKWTPSPTEWGLLEELLAATVDRIADLIVATWNSTGPKQPMQPVPRFPRPVTEMDRARERAEKQALGAFEALIEQAKTRWSAEHGGE